jgi:hypothetical protein
MRENDKVFTLLETIYNGSMRSQGVADDISKVERWWCYVAVCGLPDPEREPRRHGTICSRLPLQVRRLTARGLAGPGTADLGLHRRTPQWTCHRRCASVGRASSSSVTL